MAHRLPSPVSAVPSLDELLARADLWRGDRLAGRAEGWPSGAAELDAVLPGAGWPRGALVEILVERKGAGGAVGAVGCGELSLFLPLLARHTQAGGWVVLVAPPLTPHAPAWAAAGVDLARLLVVAAEARDRLWAIDRALRSGAAEAVLAWLPQTDPSALRRLQFAAEDSGATLFAFRPPACAAQSSPAPLRLALRGAPDGVEIRILKRRGPLLARPITVPVARPVVHIPQHKVARNIAGMPATERVKWQGVLA